MNPADSRPHSNAPWVLLIVLAAWVGTGIIWRLHFVHYRLAAEVSIGEYLAFKEAGSIREVWITDHELTARMDKGLVRGARLYPYVHALLPPAFVLHPAGLLKMATEGLEPGQVHYEANSR